MIFAVGERLVLACALSLVQRVPDLTWQPRELLHQREGGFLQTGLLSVRAPTFLSPSERKRSKWFF